MGGMGDVMSIYVTFLVKLAAVAIQCLDLFIKPVIKKEVYMYGWGGKSGVGRKEQSKNPELSAQNETGRDESQPFDNAISLYHLGEEITFPKLEGPL